VSVKQCAGPKVSDPDVSACLPMNPLNIVILAAGQGKRMHSDLPKVLHPVAGKPLLAYVLGAARALSPQRICVVYGHGGDVVAARFPEQDLIWVQQAQQLGTGHAVIQALPHLDPGATALVLYGDMPRIAVATLQTLLAAAGEGLAILTAHTGEPGFGRIVRDAAGKVKKIVERRDATSAELSIREVNLGLLAATSGRLRSWLAGLGNDNAQQEYYLTDVVALAAGDGCDITTVQPGNLAEVAGVNSKGELAALERAAQGERAERLLDAGVTLADPARIDVRGELECGRDVSIDVNCIFEGKVELGDQVTVGANCILRDVRVAAGTRIAPFCHLEGAQIGARCVIGPYARIRPGTQLAAEVHIGNFVEVKNSEIGVGSKANHLAYVGDATIGQNVNIGAGTITCNYDGANKHRTVIEDDVFIGSDTQLVAPVIVRRGATLGAGTTLTHEAPAETLTVSRARQRSIPGWKRPVKAGPKLAGPKKAGPQKKG
jgi:bifunctional UDP-N-acetylglucosamine pyrophosphorylase/glucosamine-1-phosphate N-acetyltransferase